MAADIPERSTVPLEGCASVAEGPRGTLWRYSNSNNCITTELSLLRQEERLWLEQWQGNWKLMTVQTVYSHGQCTRPPLWDLWTLMSPRRFILRRVCLLFQSRISWGEDPSAGFGCRQGCLLCFSSPERWVHNGWRKWRWTCFKFSGFDNSFGWLFLKDNRKMQVISVFAKGTVQWSRWDFTHLQKQGPLEQNSNLCYRTTQKA